MQIFASYAGGVLDRTRTTSVTLLGSKGQQTVFSSKVGKWKNNRAAKVHDETIQNVKHGRQTTDVRAKVTLH